MSRKHVSSNLFPWDRHTLPLGYLNVKKIDCIVFLLNMNVVFCFKYVVCFYSVLTDIEKHILNILSI